MLVLSGIGLALMPEDVIFLLGGYLASLDFIRLPTVLVVLILGVLGADTSGYWVGRLYGAWIEIHIVRRWQFAARILGKVKGLFERHGEKIVMMGRPLMGLRIAIPMFAGHTGMKFGRFLRYDAVLSILWTFALVSIGYYLGATLDIFAEARVIKHWVFLALVVAVSLYTALRFLKGICSRMSPRQFMRP